MKLKPEILVVTLTAVIFVDVFLNTGHLEGEECLLPPGIQLLLNGHLVCRLVIILTLQSQFLMLHFFIW
jgi:hypothetical protein